LRSDHKFVRGCSWFVTHFNPGLINLITICSSLQWSFAVERAAFEEAADTTELLRSGTSEYGCDMSNSETQLPGCSTLGSSAPKSPTIMMQTWLTSTQD
jgi:hypothetical protein